MLSPGLPIDLRSELIVPHALEKRLLLWRAEELFSPGRSTPHQGDFTRKTIARGPGLKARVSPLLLWLLKRVKYRAGKNDQHVHFLNR